MSCIPLAKPFTPSKLNFPVMVSQKYDGVPVRIDIDKKGYWTVRSRQGKDVPSVHTLVDEFVKGFINQSTIRTNETLIPSTIVGEVIQLNDTNADFKDTSGIVRRQTDQSHLLQIVVFECDVYSAFIDRFGWLKDNVDGVHPQVCSPFQITISSLDSLKEFFVDFQMESPEAEGLIIRNCVDPWTPGKRSWGYQKLLVEPTIDLRIIDVYQAVDKYGEPKDMIGGLIAAYKDTTCKIGPGKMTHEERTSLWYEYMQARAMDAFPNRIAKIKYKKDDSYTVPRQPTWQCWHDKLEPDA